MSAPVVRHAVRSRAGDYAVEVGQGVLDALGARVRERAPGARVALVTDETVGALWAEPALASLRAAGVEATVLPVPPGESSKSLGTAEALWGQLIAGGFGRADVVVALGGGVVGDLAGFVAATFHRGMRLVQVPTTLLAQVDASIGGKVAIDHPLGKNLVGAFHPPLAVLADVRTLASLPERERWNGLAEVVKTALVLDAELLPELERDLEALGAGRVDAARWTDVVGRTAGTKARLVSEDELERGPRMLLNFGHTVGHALESATGHGPLMHGEAVVLGMHAAVSVSARLGRLSAPDAARARGLLERFPPPPPVTRPAREAVLAAAARDKKGTRYVVLDGLGRGVVEAALPPELLASAVDVALGRL